MRRRTRRGGQVRRSGHPGVEPLPRTYGQSHGLTVMVIIGRSLLVAMLAISLSMRTIARYSRQYGRGKGAADVPVDLPSSWGTCQPSARHGTGDHCRRSGGRWSRLAPRERHIPGRSGAASLGPTAPARSAQDGQALDHHGTLGLHPEPDLPRQYLHLRGPDGGLQASVVRTEHAPVVCCGVLLGHPS
jgi:hypothetical protein